MYDIEGFLEKNNDSLHDNLLDLLDATEDSFLRSVIEFVDPDAGSELLDVARSSHARFTIDVWILLTSRCSDDGGPKKKINLSIIYACVSKYHRVASSSDT